MSKNKIQKLLKKILLENKPKEYCSNYNGKYSMTVDYKNCRIHISHNPIVETKKQKGFFAVERWKLIQVGHIQVYIYIQITVQ